MILTVGIFNYTSPLLQTELASRTLAGVDSVWEQKKLEARKLRKNSDDWAREHSTATTVRPA